VEPYKSWAWLECASCSCLGLAGSAGSAGSGNTVDFDIAVAGHFGMADLGMVDFGTVGFAVVVEY